MLDHNNPDTWLEIPFQNPPAASVRRVHQSADSNAAPGMAYAPCRCWRCRGGVALADRATLDRLLAKHLITLSESERGQWMLFWAAHPRHDADALDQMNTWLRIAGGSKEPAPVYALYVMPEEA
ncbi:hypothetical protein [Achromobacter sp. Root565]|uniref:hypothetical protein n=1 Tax=Achromobacter sp. Root565 TaxID=1736564 RepID=UPI000ABF56BA|nr:hypothetical protein [Achromobacter sp. Root565]